MRDYVYRTAFDNRPRQGAVLSLLAVAGSVALAYTVYELYGMFGTEAQPDYTRVLSPPSELPSMPSTTPIFPSFAHSSGTIKLFGAQESAKSTIMAIAQSKASPRFGAKWLAFAQGLVANAYGESRLNPAAIGDSGYAYGLFQLNFASPSALGSQALKIYSKQQLLDPSINASFFIDTCLRTPQVTAAISTGDPYKCSDAITRYVERPANIEKDSATRKTYLTGLFGRQSTFAGWYV